MKQLIRLVILFIIFTPMLCFGQTISDYLILDDIGLYKLSKPEKLIPGFAPTGGPSESQWSGVLASTDHFKDHSDMTYEVMYLGGGAGLASPIVQITQHSRMGSQGWGQA
ncbi:MAG: hypothetical protein KJ950_02205 [Proteobacteria bacterium]|nr:hypothetical protein [Pseudomonadota bacterium]